MILKLSEKAKTVAKDKDKKWKPERCVRAEEERHVGTIIPLVDPIGKDSPFHLQGKGKVIVSKRKEMLGIRKWNQNQGKITFRRLDIFLLLRCQ